MTSPKSFVTRSLGCLAALAVLLTWGCGSVLRGALVAPDKGGPAWTAVTTEHFVLETDVDPATATQAAAKLEEMFSALAELGFATEDRPKMSIDVVYFGRAEEYAVLRPAATAGQFLPGGSHDPERRPLAIFGGDFVQSTKAVLLHELTHLFVHEFYPQAPVWLNEGLAEYFETLAIEDGSAVLGRASAASRFWRGPWQWRWDPTGWRALIPMSEAPTAQELRAMRRDFYGDLSADPSTSRGQQALRPTKVHYQAAWCLVRLLYSEPAYAETFRDYLARLHAGENEAVAWDATVGALGEDRLEASYRAALVPLETTVLRAKFTPPAASAAPLRPMTAAEVHVLWARLRDWKSKEGRAGVAADLESVANEHDAATVMLRALWAAESVGLPAGEAILRDALVVAPHERELWNALGWIIVERGGPDAAKELELVARNLAADATSAAEIDLLGRAQSLGGHPEAGLALEKRALSADPSCIQCLISSSMMLAKSGHFSEAVEAASLALNLAPEARRPPIYLAAIEKWKQQAGSGAPSAPPPPVPHADAVLAAMRARFHPCFEGSEHAPGQAEMVLKIDAHGAVTGATARPGATFPPTVVACIAGILKGGHFPAPGADTTLLVPIRVGGK